MDLRPFLTSREQALRGARLLDYQPFILADDIQTGIAYDWIYAAEDPGRYVGHRDQTTEQQWQRFMDANRQLRTMYDEWIAAVIENVPDGETVLDIACNSGYFLQRFAQAGYRECIGYDLLNKSEVFEFLNTVLGTRTRFIHRSYDSWTHEIAHCPSADVVIASAILLHLSDPLYFLQFLGDITNRALLLFTKVIRTEEYLIQYMEPNEYYKDAPFPVCFDNNNAISTGLLSLSLKRLGFRNVIELRPNNGWINAPMMSMFGIYVCVR